MTQLRKYRDAISNYFDQLEAGVGKRGSSFMDVDAVSHDKDTGRFLFREFKEPDEPLHPATRMVLTELAHLPRCTVWFLRRLDHNRIGWAQFGSGMCEETLTEAEYLERLEDWWQNRPIVNPPALNIDRMVRADEIHW